MWGKPREQAVAERAGDSRSDLDERAGEHWRALFTHNPLMCFTISADGTVLAVNDTAVRELGYPPEELVDRSVLDVFVDEDRDAVLAKLTESLADPDAVHSWILRKRRRDGSVVTVREHARSAMERDGRTVVYVMCEDVTDELRAMELEERLRDSRLRRRHALDLNDRVVQGLAAAVYAFECNAPDVARQRTRATLAQARRLMGELLEATGRSTEPGASVADEALTLEGQQDGSTGEGNG